ncbi:MAG TPA: beta-propeller fold lactonase family protein [Solirubrobacteraceae bacterium]|jgi:6-phosphogluconolactonase (cycloisomerase 2 family)
MRAATRLCTIGAIAVTAIVGSGASSALASSTEQTVFVQTDNAAGNQIVAYDRGADGTLSQAGSYATGGLGGALAGSVVDHLASQGSLAYDREDRLLYAVNAGSNTISVFAVLGDRLALRQVLSSGGTFPVSLTVEHGVLYVLNAEEGGSLQGFVVDRGRLTPLPHSQRALGLDPNATPQFTHTPGQVAFTPDSSQLIVTTKGNGSAIDVFAVHAFGRLSQRPTVNVEAGAVPFGVTFDAQGDLVVSEAGTNALASFSLHEDGTLSQLDAVGTGQAATCWVARAGSRFYTSNAGSASLSAFQSSAGGQLLSLLGTTETDAGTVDAAVADGSRYLYVQAGAAGVVDEFAIGAPGALSKLGSVTVPGAVGGEGIAAG